MDNTPQTFVKSGNEKPIEDIVSKLIFLSKIKPGEKINVKELFIRNNNNIYQRIARTFTYYGESKDETLDFIKDVINDSIELICIYSKKPNTEFNISIADLLIEKLEYAKEGLHSFCETYEEDRLFVSKIEAVLHTLDAKMNNLTQGKTVETNKKQFRSKRDRDLDN